MKKNCVLIIFMIVLLVVITAGCGTEEEPANGEVNDTVGEDPEEDSEDGSRGLFFEVTGGGNQAYLFGSVHTGTEEMYPLDKEVYQAFERSGVLGLEIDMASLTELEISQKMSQIGAFDDGRQMTDVVSEEIFKETLEVLSGYGVDKEDLNRLKPWFVAMDITSIAAMEAGFSPDFGVDDYFLEQAEEEGMEVIGLESVSTQLEPYKLLSEESQEIYLKNTLDEMDEAEEQLGELIDLWKAGEKEAFAEIRQELLEDTETVSLRDYQEAFLDTRDEQMTAKIVELLEEGEEDTYFIVVGALHLAGKNSIVEQLYEKGYQVERPN